MTRLGFATALTAIFALMAPAMAFDGWRQQSATVIEGKASGFDYITFDATKNRLFLGRRKDGLQVFDIASRTIVKTIDGTAEHSSNGALLLPEFDLGISTNEDGTIIPFVLSTLEAKPAIKLGHELDSSYYDPSTKRIFVNSEGDDTGTDVIVLEAPSLKILGTIRLATKKAEHAEGDGRGNYYLAAKDLDIVYKIDPKAMKVVAEWPTPGCARPTGLAINHLDSRILLGCRGSAKTPPSFAVLNPATGKITFSAEIAEGNDGVIFDPELKRVFLSNGVGANLMVFEPVGPDAYKLVEALGTRPLAKTLTMDPKSKKLYMMTAEGTASAAKTIKTANGTFYPNTFYPNTFVVLSYARQP